MPATSNGVQGLVIKAPLNFNRGDFRYQDEVVSAIVSFSAIFMYFVDFCRDCSTFLKVPQYFLHRWQWYMRRKPCHVSPGEERFVAWLLSFNEVFDYAPKNCNHVAFVHIVFVLNSKVLFTYTYHTVERRWWSLVSHWWLLNMWFKTGDIIASEMSWRFDERYVKSSAE